MQRLLVIGGGQFVGRHLVAAALARGDHVTVFNRGRIRDDWPASVDVRIGDRRGDLAVLADGDWDAVIDTCGYLPRDVERMARCLHGRVARYVFVSSVSVYAGFETPNHEGSPLGAIDDAETDVIDGRTYGPLKALCERAASEVFGDAATLVVRPGLIVGPHDPTQRFTYWPARIARAAASEPVLVPGTPDDPVQMIDARDLADFMLGAVDARLAGRFNVVAPDGLWRWGEVLTTCAEVASTRPRWIWADADAVDRLGLRPWTDLPLWLPPRGDTAGAALTDARAALAAGLTLRPLRQTVADVLDWHRSLEAPAREFVKAGLSGERETAALAALAALRAPA